jgi:hypothetical protein
LIGAPTETRGSPRSSRIKYVSTNASRKTLKKASLNNAKEFGREVKEAAPAAVKNAWVALMEEHEIMNIIFKNQAQFPRSERVLVVSAAVGPALGDWTLPVQRVPSIAVGLGCYIIG